MIKYVKGDATRPQGSGEKIIAHCCNDEGKWGSGFVLAINNTFGFKARKMYREWSQGKLELEYPEFKLGAVQIVQVAPEIHVANMIGQHLTGTDEYGQPCIRYYAIRDALMTLAECAIDMDASVHAPRFGCGLAGGRWEKIEPLIVEHLCNNGIEVTIYDYQNAGRTN